MNWYEICCLINKMQKELFGKGYRSSYPSAEILETAEEVTRGACGQCVFYLNFRSDYNCGYLIRKVQKNSGCCRYFQSLTMMPFKER
jgi:hypothetical protein